MNTLIHADVFFFITSIAIIFLTAAVIVALVFFIRILMDVKQISKKVRTETALVVQDIDDLRTQTKKEGMRFKFFLKFLDNIFKRKRKKIR